MDSSSKPHSSHKSGTRIAPTIVASAGASASPPKHNWCKAKMAWKQVLAAKKDKTIQLGNIITSMQSIIRQVGAAPSFADKLEVMEMITICKDVIKDLYDDTSVETERALKAFKVFQNENGSNRRNKIHGSLMRQTAKILHTIDEKTTVGGLRTMVLNGLVTVCEKSVSRIHHSFVRVVAY